MPIHINQLTPAELERLSWCVEEAAELIQAINKIIRYGYFVRIIDKAGKEVVYNNREDLERELANLMVSSSLLIVANDLLESNIEKHVGDKLSEAMDYLHHQDPRHIDILKKRFSS